MQVDSVFSNSAEFLKEFLPQAWEKYITVQESFTTLMAAVSKEARAK